MPPPAHSTWAARTDDWARKDRRLDPLQHLLAHETTLREIDTHLGDLYEARQAGLGAWLFEVLTRIAAIGEDADGWILYGIGRDDGSGSTSAQATAA